MQRSSWFLAILAVSSVTGCTSQVDSTAEPQSANAEPQSANAEPQIANTEAQIVDTEAQSTNTEVQSDDVKKQTAIKKQPAAAKIGNQVAVTEKRIRELVEQLASKNSRPTSGSQSQFFDRPDDWNEKHQERVYEAREQLEAMGKSAFPILLQNLHDDRYSLTASYAAEVNHCVGEVCSLIITSTILSGTGSGSGYKSRKGADGETHMSPSYFSEKYDGDLERWWRENGQKSMRRVRLDILEWRIAQEARIGFPPDGSGQELLTRIKDKLKELQASD